LINIYQYDSIPLMGEADCKSIWWSWLQSCLVKLYI